MLRARRPDRLARSYIIDFSLGRLGLRVLKTGPGGLAPALLAGLLFLIPAALFAEEAPAGGSASGPVLADYNQDRPEAGTGLVLGDGVVLRPVTSGVVVERDRSGAHWPAGWAGGLLMLFGFGLGLAAAALVLAYLVRRSEKFRSAEPGQNLVPVVLHSLERPGPWKDHPPEPGDHPEPDLAPMLEALRAIENRIKGLDLMFRSVDEKMVTVGGLHQELQRQVTMAGHKLARLESRLNRTSRPAGGRTAVPAAAPGEGAAASEPPAPAESARTAEPRAPEMKESADPTGPREFSENTGRSVPVPPEEPAGRPESSAETRSRPPEDVPDTPGLNLHARARYLRNLGGRMMNDGLLSGAEANFSQSLAILKTLVGQEPDNQVCLRDLVLAYHNQGRILERMGRLDEAADYYQQSVQLTASLAEKAPDCFDWQRGLAASHGHLGRIQAAAGNCGEAEKSLTTDVELMRALVEKRPDSRPWRYALAGSLHNLALIQEKLGLHDQALRSYQQEMDLMRQLIKDEPDDQLCALNLGAVCGAAGRLLKDMGQVAEALEAASQYVELMRAMVGRDPGDGGLKRELTVALGQMGRLRELSGDFDRALADFEEALEIRRALALGAPANDIWQCDLAVGLCKVGDTHFASQRWEEALNFYREALEVVEALEKKHGPEGAWLIEKCGILLRMGNFYRNTDAVRALDYYRQALVIAEARVKAGGGADWSELEAVIKGNMGR